MGGKCHRVIIRLSVRNRFRGTGIWEGVARLGHLWLWAERDSGKRNKSRVIYRGSWEWASRSKGGSWDWASRSKGSWEWASRSSQGGGAKTVAKSAQINKAIAVRITVKIKCTRG